MQTDQQGLALTGAGNRGAELFRAGLDELVYFKSSVLETFDKAILEEPGFALPYFARAYLDLFMTEKRFAEHAQRTLDKARTRVDFAKLSDRELQHALAIEAWIEGDLRQAARILDRLGIDEPRDILALRIGHELDFFTGNKRALRDRVARQLSAWSPSDIHYGIVQGCFAFGLEENGEYERAAQHGFIALSARPDDVWAIHAVTHSYEMRGDIGEGLRFMGDRRRDWAENNLFSAHNSWHEALFNSDIYRHSEALDIYDRAIFNESSPRLALVLLDASSLLWRLHLQAVDVGHRFQKLASAWDTLIPEESFYVFNDVHAIMAYIGAGRLEDARGLVNRLERYVNRGKRSSNNYSNTLRVGLPLTRGLLAFGEGKYGDAVDELYAVRERAIEFGGSEAQRDAIDRTLIEAAVRSGHTSLSKALASERVHDNAGNPHNWSKMAEVLRLSRALDEAAASEAKSKTLIADAFNKSRAGAEITH